VRILYLSDVYFPRVNGVSTSIATFRAELHRLGHVTTLVAPEYGDAGQRDTPPDRIVRVPSRPVPLDPEDRAMRWRALREALRGLREARFDLVHVQTPFLAHYAGVRLAWECRLPCVATYHTFFAEYFHHYLPMLPDAVSRFVARRMSRSQCNAVDTVVVPSSAIAQALRDYGVSRPVEIVPTGLDIESMAGGDGAAFRVLHGVAPWRPMLLYVGRVAHEKNLDFLLRMFATVRRQMPAAVLVVCGEGPALPHLRRLARDLALGDAVRFIGYLDRARELPGCYAAADLFVFASRTETQGLVLLEALAAGTPVVALATLGTRDVLAGCKGAAIAPDDERGFADLAVALLGDPSRRAALAAAAPSDAARWAAATMARRLEALYARLVRTAGARREALGSSRGAAPFG
jgi:glycosyltransferase involved in cell wall biosynthesis